MDQPVYVIKSVESVWTYKYNGKIYDVLKKVVWILVILFIISSLFFHKNTFMELAFGTRLLLIIMSVIILGTAYATEKTPSPFEIRFYEDNRYPVLVLNLLSDCRQIFRHGRDPVIDILIELF